MAISTGTIVSSSSVTIGGNNNNTSFGVMYDETTISKLSKPVIIPTGYVLFLSAYGPESSPIWVTGMKVVRGGSLPPYAVGQGGGIAIDNFETILYSRPYKGVGGSVFTLTPKRDIAYITRPGTYQFEIKNDADVGDIYVEFGLVRTMDVYLSQSEEF